jgi:hypothetical protein
LKVIAKRSKKRETALLLVAMPRCASSAQSSDNVMSAFSLIRALNQAASPSSGDVRPPPCGFALCRPSSREACTHLTAVEALTSKTFACDRAERPCATDRRSRTRKSFEYAMPASSSQRQDNQLLRQKWESLPIHINREWL